MTSGAVLFARFAYPPNSLGYCGPADTELLGELVASGEPPFADLRNTIVSFAGAWPYLELIAADNGFNPLSSEVVEAYWIGNSLLNRIDTLSWGNSLDDRFRARAGSEWDRLVAGLLAGGVPNHAFHVFCVYPWVGLLRSGIVEQSLRVLDRCRIRWGRVVGASGEQVLVASQPLRWDGTSLYLADHEVESVLQSVDPDLAVAPGDKVALHWDYICQRLSDEQLGHLQRQHAWHLALANREAPALSIRA